jgi:hypothetical protein
MLIAKIQGKDKWVQIVRFAHEVKFSPERGWLLTVADWEKPFRKRTQLKWIPATTRFESSRELIGD